MGKVTSVGGGDTSVHGRGRVVQKDAAVAIGLSNQTIPNHDRSRGWVCVGLLHVLEVHLFVSGFAGSGMNRAKTPAPTQLTHSTAARQTTSRKGEGAEKTKADKRGRARHGYDANKIISTCLELPLIHCHRHQYSPCPHSLFWARNIP